MMALLNHDGTGLYGVHLIHHCCPTSAALNGVTVGGHILICFCYQKGARMGSTILEVSCWKIGHGHVIL